MSRHVYIFIDETGDPGSVLREGASSSYYAEIALQVNEEGWAYFIEHLVNWKYVLGKFQEFKSLPARVDQMRRFVSPLVELYNQKKLFCTCVYLLKADYAGPYLMPSSTSEPNPIWFRNFVHRKLLEHHFRLFPAHDSEIELVFDRYRMTSKETINLQEYLADNWRLPRFEHICHVNSLYSEAVQVASQLVNAMKDIVLDTADKDRRDILDFIVLEDITRS